MMLYMNVLRMKLCPNLDGISKAMLNELALGYQHIVENQTDLSFGLTGI